MILRSLAVEGWRCFANRIEIGPLGDGINVLHGPNASGKSTLMGALIRGLFDNHGGTAAGIKALRPWGRELNPAVEIRFEHDGETYEVLKRFLQGSRSDLSREENGRMVRIAEGAEANQRLREMLSGEAPAKGETSLQHWGIAQILWAPQKGIALDRLSANMTAAIQQALGAALLAGSEIESRVDERYFRIFTQGGKLISGAHAPPVIAMEEKLTGAQELRERIAAKMKEYDEASRSAEDFCSRRDQAQRDCRQRQRDLDAIRQRAQQYRDARTACDRHRADAAEAQSQYDATFRRVEGLKTARQELAEARKSLDHSAEDLSPLRRQSEQCRTELENADARLDRIRAGRAAVDVAEKRAGKAADFNEQHRRLQETDELLRRIDEATRRESELRQQRLEIVAPDAKTLKAIRTTVGRRDQAQIQFDAALITVRFIPEQPFELEVIHAEELGNRPVTPAAACEIKGSPEVAFRIPGIGTIRATGPTGSVDDLREQIARADREIEKLTEGFGARDLDELQSLNTRAAAVDAELGNAQAALKALLAGRQADDIRKQRAELAVGVDAILREYPAWSAKLPDVDALRSEHESIRAAFVREVERAEALQKQAQQASNLADRKLTNHEADHKQVQKRVDAAGVALDALANDGKDDAQREVEMRQRAMRWQAAQAQCDEAQRRLAELGADPAKEAQILEGQVRHLEAAVSDFDKRYHGEQVRLQTLASEAPYSALAQVDETIEDLKASIARERLRYGAVRLLYERIQDHRKSLNQKLLGPVTERASGMLERIAGPRIGSLQLGPDFLPQGVVPEAAGAEVGLDELCGGEQEQVHLAARLALAEVLFRKQRQLVVLDDALTYTDSGRFARILGILEEAAAQFQILVLTCHPERYSGLAGACFFELEKR